MALLAVGAAALYGLAPQIFDVWAQVPGLRALGWAGLVAMLGCELISFVCAWGLHRVALPGLSWFGAGTTQLTSNAVSRAVPGGAAMGAGVSVKMWTIAGVDLGNAAGALAATSLISTATLFLLPFVALCVAAFGAPIPRNLAVVAGGAGILAALLFGVGTLLMSSDRAAGAAARFAARVSGAVARRMGREGLDPDDVMARRAELAGRARRSLARGARLGGRQLDLRLRRAGLGPADPRYTRPRFGLVLMAYGAAAVLAMIPITPGGLGFVEAGLTSLLTLAGIPAADALLATLAYRIVSFWLPLALGPIAWSGVPAPLPPAGRSRGAPGGPGASRLTTRPRGQPVNDPAPKQRSPSLAAGGGASRWLRCRPGPVGAAGPSAGSARRR